MKKSVAIVRVVERYRPISGDSIGRYLQVAIPNEAGYSFGKPMMSFEKPYRLEPDRLIVTDADILKCLERLSKHYTLRAYVKP